MTINAGVFAMRAKAALELEHKAICIHLQSINLKIIIIV